MRDDSPPAGLHAAVTAALAAASGRVVRFEQADVSGWIKRAVPSKKRFLHRVQSVVAALLPWPILRTTVSGGGAQGLADEAARIAALAARGVPVPTVIARTPDWLLLSDLGSTLKSLMDGAPARRPELACAAAKALAQLHRLGGWHGRAMLNDFVLMPDGRIGFIDFEENVGRSMPLPARQARDVGMLAISAARYESGTPGLVRLALAAYVEADGSPDVWPELRRLMPILVPLKRTLSPFADRFGKDVRSAVAGVGALEDFLERPFNAPAVKAEMQA